MIISETTSLMEIYNTIILLGFETMKLCIKVIGWGVAIAVGIAFIYVVKNYIRELFRHFKEYGL